METYDNYHRRIAAHSMRAKRYHKTAWLLDKGTLAGLDNEGRMYFSEKLFTGNGVGAKKKLASKVFNSIREQLQADTDKWLKGALA